MTCHYDDLSALQGSKRMSSFKRAFDVVGACAGLLVFAPVMAVVAAAVLIDDGRPVLFRQQRLGYRRRPFSIVKIRTMRDGRITRVGKVLRASGLDEVPQFINILSGDLAVAVKRQCGGNVPDDEERANAAKDPRRWRECVSTVGPSLLS